MGGKGVDLFPTGQRIVVPALARIQKLRHNLQLQVTSLGRAPVATKEFVASKLEMVYEAPIPFEGNKYHEAGVYSYDQNKTFDASKWVV